jgi:hypothetical protein
MVSAKALYLHRRSRRTRRQLSLPLALRLLDWVLRIVRHVAGAAEKCAEEGDIGHRSVDGRSLRSAKGATESACRIRTDKGGSVVGNGVEGADDCGERWEAHK